MTGIVMSLSNNNIPRPILFYNPADSSSYSGSGTTINSLVTPNLTGTMTSITYTSPYFAYNGSTSKVAVADNTLLEPGTGNWTMEAWAYISANSGSQVILGRFDNGGAAANASYSIRVANGVVYAQFGDGLGNVVNATEYSFTMNTWYHLVYSWSMIPTKNITAYVNGVSIGTVSHSLSRLLNSVNPLYLGSYNGGEYSQWFTGRMGIVRLYNSALNAGQVLANYNLTKGIYGL